MHCPVLDSSNDLSGRGSRYILVVARLVGPLLEPADLSVGYDWCRQQLVQAYPQLGNEVQLAKAWAYLGRKEYQTAIGILKVCLPGWLAIEIRSWCAASIHSEDVKLNAEHIGHCSQ